MTPSPISPSAASTSTMHHDHDPGLADSSPEPAEVPMRPFELDDLVHLEEMFLEMGREEGKSDGLRAGRPEGFTLGLEKGFDMLTEVGYYESCAQLWLDLITAGVANARPPTTSAATTAADDADDEEMAVAALAQVSRRRQVFPERAAKSLSSFLILVRSFPHHNALDTGILELLERIRGKWKLVCAVTGVPMSLASYSQGNAWADVSLVSTALLDGSQGVGSVSRASTPLSASDEAAEPALANPPPTNAVGAKVSVSQSLSF